VPEALLGGEAALRAEAIAAAAKALAASRNPVIAGLMTDMAGAIAALALARATGAALDHAYAGWILRDLDVLRSFGGFLTTPLQTRALADCVLLVGETVPDFAPSPPTLAPERTRTVLRLAGAGLGVRLGVLRAVLAGRNIAADAALHALAESLRAARFGVAVFSAGELDALALEMLAGLIADLNAKTRFFGLPMAAPGNAVGVMHALAAKTGYPVRIGFARGEAEHDPWRFDAARMAESGETDLVLWIGESLPEWAERVRLIALVPEGVTLKPMPEVVMFAGKPGIDHAAVLYDAELGTLAFRRGAGISPSIAEILQSITKSVQAW
jgi:formylmethanofuran dehydrogenase subunit B